MADLAELHQELGSLIGFTLAAVLILRRAAALAAQEDKHELARLLQQLDSATGQVERRSQMLVGRHAGLRAGTITAKARQIKAGIMGYCREDATVRDLLELLKGLMSQIRISTAALTAHSSSSNDMAVAEFAEFLVLAQESWAIAVAEASDRLERAN